MKASYLGLLLTLPLAAQAPPTPPTPGQSLTKQEALELKNIQLSAQVVQDMGQQIATLQEKQRTMSAEQTKAYSDLKEEVESDHPGFTLDNFGNIVAKTAAKPPTPPPLPPAKK